MAANPDIIGHIPGQAQRLRVEAIGLAPHNAVVPSSPADLQALENAEQSLDEVHRFLRRVKGALFHSLGSAAERFDDPYLQARREIGMRRKRNYTFGDAIFSDPAWDILLLLFSKLPERECLFVSELSMEGRIPLTTTLRWIATLEAKALVWRRDDENDRRAVNIGLTTHGQKLMRSYFAD